MFESFCFICVWCRERWVVCSFWKWFSFEWMVGQYVGWFFMDCFM